MTEAGLLLAIFVGGLAGGVFRYAVSGLVARAAGETFPWGTMVVNGTGALAIGLLAAVAATGRIGDPAWLVAVIGVLGSYTTVSSFGLQTLALARDSEWLPALFNIVGSLALCLGAAMAGYLAGTAVWA